MTYISLSVWSNRRASLNCVADPAMAITKKTTTTNKNTMLEYKKNQTVTNQTETEQPKQRFNIWIIYYCVYNLNKLVVNYMFSDFF